MRRQATTLGAVIALAGVFAACGSLDQRRDGAAEGPFLRNGGAAAERPFVREDGAAVDGSLAREHEVGGDASEAAPADAVVDVAPNPTTLVQTSREPWGGNCPRGGVKIVTALDLNGNRTIDAEDETVGMQILCNVYPVSVSLGPQHGCALASSGAVWCWGADDVGQLGDYGEYAAYAPRPVAGVETALALAVGGWGDDSLGQLGIGIASASRSTSEPQPAIWPLAP